MSAHSVGAGFEREVAAVLREHGFPYAERAYRLGVHDDRGDIDGCPGIMFECRNRARIDLAPWIDEITDEAERHNAMPVLVVKRRRKHADRAYAVMELARFADLLAELDGRRTSHAE